MSFVDECRREWKRLGVPDAVANEMAAELTADLAEAEAEGASPEEVLGRAVFDAPAFAASWAMERGVVGAMPQPRPRALVLAFVAVLALFVAVAAAGVAVLADPDHFTSSSARIAVGSGFPPVRLWRARVGPPRARGSLPPKRIFVVPSRRAVQLVALPRPPATAGLVLLGVGLGGIATTLGAGTVLERRRRAIV
jgi:hypothetical protein